MAAGYFSGGTTYSYDIHDQGGASTADHHINLHTLYLMNPTAATSYVGFPMDQATTSPANMQVPPLLMNYQQSTAAGISTNNQQQLIGLIPIPDQTVQARRLPAAASHDANLLLLRQLQYNLMWGNNNAVTISDSTFAQSATADDQQSGNHHDHDQLQLIMSPTNTGQNLPAATTANSVLGIGSLIGTNDQQQQAGTLSLSLSSSAPDHLQRLAAASNVLQLLPVIVSAADQAAAERGSVQDQMKITRPMKWDSENNNILQKGYPCNYVKAAQQLLDEVVNVRNIMTAGKKAVATAYNKEGSSKLKRELSSTSSISGHDQVGSTGGGGDNDQEVGACGKKLQGTISSSDHQLSVAEKQELQVKKTKLVTMLDEVEQRYRQYQHEMQLVVSSFEAAAGVGAANTYTSLALHTISKQFRCLRDAISAQVRSTSLSLGEDAAAAVDGSSRHFRYVDNQLRQQQQQRALQQLGIIQQNAWRPQRGLPERAVSVLRAWLFEHFLHPYPKDADKHLLAKQTGLTRSQVSNWFINARVRLWKPMVEEMYTEELKQQHDQHNNELILNNNNNNNNNNSDDHQDVQIKDKNTTATATSNHPLKMNDQSTNNSSTKSSATTTTTTTTPSADDHDQISTSPPVTTHAQQTKIKKTNTKLRRQDQKKDSTPMNSSNDQNMMKKTNTVEAAVIPTSSTSGDPADQNIVLPTTGFNMINTASSSDNGHVPIAHLQLDHMAFLNHINSDSKKMIFRNMNGHRDSMMISTTMTSSSTNNIAHEVAAHHDQLINSNQEAAHNIKEYAMNINDDQYHRSYRSSDVTTYAFTTAAAGIDNNIGGGFGAYHQLLANNINATSCRFSAADHGANNTNGSVSLTLGLPDHDCSDSVLSACSLPAADHNDHSHDQAHDQPNFITNQNMSLIGTRNSSTTAAHQHHHHDHSNDYCVFNNSMPETSTTTTPAADHIIINPFENLNNMQSSRKRYAAAQSATFA